MKLWGWINHTRAEKEKEHHNKSEAFIWLQFDSQIIFIFWVHKLVEKSECKHFLEEEEEEEGLEEEEEV